MQLFEPESRYGIGSGSASLVRIAQNKIRSGIEDSFDTDPGPVFMWMDTDSDPGWFILQ